MSRAAQVHFGDPPGPNEHEWVQEWLNGTHEFKNLRYRCARCKQGPFTASQITTRVNRRCVVYRL